jgi:putative ABC transport system ATP-binding protein
LNIDDVKRIEVINDEEQRKKDDIVKKWNTLVESISDSNSEEDYWKNQSGSLQILGNELCKANVKQLTQARRTNGYIFQAHNLHGSLTAIQNVRMGLEVQGKMSGKEMLIQSQKMLEEVGLGNRLNYYPDNLSGGQKQRIAIARALVSQPKIILADEPTAALDRQSGRDVVELMQKLAKEHGCTILLVTHDNRILDIADRIVYMEDGHLVREKSDSLQDVVR